MGLSKTFITVVAHYDCCFDRYLSVSHTLVIFTIAKGIGSIIYEDMHQSFTIT